MHRAREWPRRGAADGAATWVRGGEGPGGPDTPWPRGREGAGDTAEGSGTSDPIVAPAVVAALAPPAGEARALLAPDAATIDTEVASRLLLSAQHLAAAQTDAAAYHARVALMLRPDCREALLALGAAAARAGDARAARAVFARAALRWPQCAAALVGLASASAADGLPAAAVAAAFAEAARVDPRCAEAQVGLASLARDAGRLDEAEAAFARAAQLSPGDARLHAFLGGIRYERGKMHDALASYTAALRLAPGFPEALNDAGNALRALGRLEEACGCYSACLAQHQAAGNALPAAAAIAHANLGAVLKLMNRNQEALTCFQTAAALQPGSAELQGALGGALKDLGHHEAALVRYRAAQAVAPTHAARAQMLHSLACVCAWDEFDAELLTVVDEARQLLAAGQPCAVQPFHAMAYDLDADFVLQLCRAHAASIVAAAALLGAPPAPRAWPADSRLRVGFVSSDFGQHPLSHLMGSVFGMLDRGRIAATVYALTPADGSVFRQRIEAEAERFVDASAMPAAELAARIAADGTQLLVDLNGYTKGSRTEAVALRPAPVQIAYMGFPSTTGADFIDWLIADGVVAPPELARCYSERLLCMPHSYLCVDYKRAFPQPADEASERPNREDVGLPSDAFVFACFNQLYKVGRPTFESWMRILSACPRAVLWLLRFPPQGEARLRAAAAAAGVAPARLVFSGVAPKEAHLARCGLADLVLDTPLCNAHTTAADALWAGAPMLTLPGERFASRVGASLLAAHGCADCIAPTAADYERRAIELYRDSGALGELKRRVRRNRDIAPLFDTRRWVTNFEAALHTAWRMHQDGDRARYVQLPDATSA